MNIFETICGDKTVWIFNSDFTDFDSIYKQSDIDFETAHENFRESLGECSNPEERKSAAHQYLDEIISIKIKYHNFSSNIDKECSDIVAALCELYEFTAEDVSKLYKFHNENDNRAISVYTLISPKKYLDKGPSKELTLSRK